MSNTTTQQGISALKAGDKERAKQLFSKALSDDKKDVQAWLGLSLVIEDQRKQRICLQRVLELEPDNRYANKWFARLESDSRADDANKPFKQEDSQTVNDEKRFSWASIKQGLFGEPHLPLLPIVLILLLLITEMFLMLIGQYTGYWHDFATGNAGSSGVPGLLTSVMRIHPLLFMLLMLGYASIMTLLLRYLAFMPSLMLWMVLFSMHLQSVLRWGRCSLWSSFQFSAESCGTVGIGSMLVIGALMGGALALVLWPRGTAVADARAQKEPRVPTWMYVVSGGWVVILVLWLTFRIFSPVEGWVPVAVDNGPSARASAGIAYDVDRETAVMFGGAAEHLGPTWSDWVTLNDTWEWNGRKWIQKQPINAPSPRFAPQMAYDPLRKVTVLFGGISGQSTFNDTWEWDGENWHFRSPSNTPSSRCCTHMFFDERRGKVVMSSGLQFPDNFWTDMWEWDGQDWQYVEAQGTVPQASGHVLAYHVEENKAVALLGDQTWVWEGDSWMYESQAVVPPARNDSAMAYDPDSQHIVLYGGIIKADGCACKDTWIYDGQRWYELSLKQMPPTSSRHMMFYDQKRDRMMIFGGYQDGATQATMWELTLPSE